MLYDGCDAVWCCVQSCRVSVLHLLRCISVPSAGEPVPARRWAGRPDIAEYRNTHVYQRTAVSLSDDDGVEPDAVSLTTHSQVKFRLPHVTFLLLCWLLLPLFVHSCYRFFTGLPSRTVSSDFLLGLLSGSCLTGFSFWNRNSVCKHAALCSSCREHAVQVYCVAVILRLTADWCVGVVYVTQSSARWQCGCQSHSFTTRWRCSELSAASSLCLVFCCTTKRVTTSDGYGTSHRPAAFIDSACRMIYWKYSSCCASQFLLVIC